MTERPLGRLTGLARAGQEGARATAKYYTRSGKEERRLVWTSFFTGITGGILWYVLILYWASIGFSSQKIGLMGGIGSAVAVPTYLVGGYLADRFGRRRLLMIGLTSTAAGLVLFLTERNFYVFTVAYSLTSIGTSLVWPSMTALMADKTTSENMKYFYGVQGFTNQIGLTIATFLGIFGPAFLSVDFGVELSSGYTFVFIATAICSIAPIVYVRRVTEVKRKGETILTSYNPKMRRILLMYCLQNGLLGLGAAFVIPWFPVIFKEGMNASGEQIALIITLSNLVLAAGWFIIPKFADLRGSVTLITASQLASIAPLLLIPYSSSLLLLVALLYTLRSLLMIVPTPVLNAYLMNVVSEKIRASFLALSQVGWIVPYAVGYAIAGYIWANDYSKVLPFYLASALYIISSVIFYVYFINVKEHFHSVGAA